LLALFLGSGLRGFDAVTSARGLLNAHGPLRALLDARPALAQLPGIGQARACLMRAALELGHRHVAAAWTAANSWPIPSRRPVLRPRLRHHARKPSPRCSSIAPSRAGVRGVVPRHGGCGRGLPARSGAPRAGHNASAVIVGHNHPSGNPEPSTADRAITARLKHALALIDVRLLDHFVVGDGPPVSLASRGTCDASRPRRMGAVDYAAVVPPRHPS
jgi:DNA repair protein RadC